MHEQGQADPSGENPERVGDQTGESQRGRCQPQQQNATQSDDARFGGTQHTVPGQRDALMRALREEAIVDLSRAELWPAPAADPEPPIAQAPRSITDS